VTVAEPARSHPALAPVREAIEVILTAHGPNPALVVNRNWDAFAANSTMTAVAPEVDPKLLEGLERCGVAPLRADVDPEQAADDPVAQAERQESLVFEAAYHTVYLIRSLVKMVETARAPARIYRGENHEERRLHRRARLLEAGLDLLGTRGWQATTVTAVCQHARLTPRYFYESFADRDQLLVAIFDGLVGEIIAEVTAGGPTDAAGLLRATVTAFVGMADSDPRKGRALFIEALGSEALVRRRLERQHWFAAQLARQAAAGARPRKHQARALRTASLIASGGLIQTMIAWLEGELDSTADQVVEQYTSVCAAGLTAALAS
jgi:AcrR family transcriptional regulator